METLGPLQVPELVEERVVFLLLERLNHCVQVALTNSPTRLLSVINYLDVDDLLAELHGAREL